MSPLSNAQNELLFDYCIGLTSPEESSRARDLISSNEEAAGVYSKFKAALAPLDSSSIESCPDELVEGTIWRLNNAARSSQLELEQLLATEQKKKISAGGFWLNMGRRFATAAVFMVAGTILFTAFNVTTNYARQKSNQQQCQMQLSSIFDGFGQYSSDNDGRMPAVATTAGQPWWKVGYNGKENQSNTRHLWLLVKGDYADRNDFVCPGSGHARLAKLSDSQLKYYNDFPSRKNVAYSFRIRCNDSKDADSSSRKVLMADLNPLFETLPLYTESLNLKLNKKLSTSNSINHERRGQNVLFGDGSVKFIKVRRVGLSEDDIFTLRDTNTYRGVEVPTCESDVFLAP
ncbi:MAG: hypothetical protein KAI59_06765 [Planctomycetes bacterium]|nr:hypothetical protein [Planctomycetota bacterium]MCK5473719.1 hypothetical protein [Planctomycetota bacterium]